MTNIVRFSYMMPCGDTAIRVQIWVCPFCGWRNQDRERCRGCGLTPIEVKTAATEDPEA